MKKGLKRFCFILGGARSGKSTFAQRLAETAAREGGLRPVYLATARVLDGEMEQRVAAHRKSRGGEWTTIEEPVDLVSRLEGQRAPSVVLIDCLTLWLSNLIEEGLTDDAILRATERLADACAALDSPVIAVSNEVGCAIVPDNPLGRRFRDLAGLANQRMAARADEVFFIAAGIALKMK